MSKDERKLFTKIMGIDDARKETRPSEIRIPKSLRLHSSGRRCGKCGHETEEGHEDAHGCWHYRCTYCVAHQKPDPNPCPRCHCTSHQEFAYLMSSYEESPFKPKTDSFRCMNCGFEWTTPEFEKYLLAKVVRSVSPKSEFLKK